MDFWQHLNASKAVDLQGVAEGLASHLSELIIRGHSVADLLAHFADDFGHLPAQHLRQLAEAHRQYQVWRRRRRKLDDARSRAKLPALPEGAFLAAPQPDQLDAIVRTARLCPRQACDSDQEWIGVLRSGVELWTRCVSITRKQGQLRCQAQQIDDPRAPTGALHSEPQGRSLGPRDPLRPLKSSGTAALAPLHGQDPAC